MSFEVILPPPTGQDIGRNDAYVVEVRSDEEVQLINIGIRFPRIVPTEIAYWGDPTSDTDFELAYNFGSTVEAVSDPSPGFSRWRFTIFRRPGWLGNPTAVVNRVIGVIGPEGPPGPTGPVGPQGPQGDPGTDGVDGTDGATGATGPQGPQGPHGNDGNDGADGSDGTDGVPGPMGPQGPQGPQGNDGADGQDGQMGSIGPRGAQGPQGPQGNDGADGADGQDGQDGKVGPAGPPGPQGPQGNDGANGQDGAVGPTGPQGPMGLMGPQGNDGADGMDGTVGATGAPPPQQVETESVGGTFTDHALPPGTTVWVFTATSTISSIANGPSLRRLIIVNAAAAGSGITVTLLQFSGGTAANRLLLPSSATVILSPGDCLEIEYISSRWRGLEGSREDLLVNTIQVDSTTTGTVDNYVCAAPNNCLVFQNVTVVLQGIVARPGQPLWIRHTGTGSTTIMDEASSVSADDLSLGPRDQMILINDMQALFLHTNGSWRCYGTSPLLPTTITVTVAGATGNMGTIDVSTIECGGTLNMSAPVANYEIEGFTAKHNGFFFYFHHNSSFQVSLNDEDTTATSTNRLRMPGNATYTASQVFGIFWYFDSRWNWVSDRALANGQNVDISSPTGNQGTIDISDLECGGTVRALTPVAEFQIEGFTAKVDGFWFHFQSDATTMLTLFDEDATATSTNRLRIPGNRDYVSPGSVHGIFYYKNSRWNWCSGAPFLDYDRVQSFTTSGTSHDVALDDRTSVLRVDAGSSNWLITGFTGGRAGRRLVVMNASNNGSRGGLANGGASSAGNTILTPYRAQRVGQNYSALLEYDSDDSLWRVLADNGTAQWTEIVESGAGPHSDYARTDDARHLCFTHAAGTLQSAVLGVHKGDLLAVSHQGTGFTDVVDNSTGTSTGRFAMVQDKTLRLIDDELAVFCALDLGAAGVAADQRWMCVSHRPPFANCADNAAGDQIQHNGTDWVSQNFLLMRERATAPTTAAGQFALSVDDTAPNILQMTNDIGTTWPVGYAASSLLTAPSGQTNSTSVSTFLSTVIPANELAAGAIIDFRLVLRVDRGLTATASSLVIAFRVNGSTTINQTIVTGTGAGSNYFLRIDGSFNILGAISGSTAYTVEANVLHTLGGPVSYTPLILQDSSTVATNASITLDLQVNFTVAVANLSFTARGGRMQRSA